MSEDDPLGMPVPPILGTTDSDNCLTVFVSVEEAETYAEAIDVEEGEWVFFDREANVLVATVEAADRIRLRRGEEFRPEELAAWLRTKCTPWWEVVGKDDRWVQAASLEELVVAFQAADERWRAERPMARLSRWVWRMIGREPK